MKNMFLPNSHSFILVKLKISKPVIQSGIFGIAESTPSLSSPYSSDFGSPRFGEASKKILLPNSHSFLLVRSVILKPVVQSDIAESVLASASGSSSSDSGKPTIINKNKRTFLKVAGIAGASLVGSLLLPKKAEALIMGSSPTTGVVGVKNSTNTRINPATEDTLNTLLKPVDLDFDGSGYLNVNVQATSDSSSSSFSDVANNSLRGLVDAARHVQVDVITSALPSSASTETTLQTISFGGKQYALKMTTDGSVDYIAEATVGALESANVWRVKKVDSTTGIVITWADGDDGFNNVATDLTGLNYL